MIPYPLPDQDILLSYSPKQNIWRVTQQLSNNLNLFCNCCWRIPRNVFLFPTGYGKKWQNSGQHDSSSSSHWSVVCWLVLGCEVPLISLISNTKKFTCHGIYITLTQESHRQTSHFIFNEALMGCMIGSFFFFDSTELCESIQLNNEILIVFQALLSYVNYCNCILFLHAGCIFYTLKTWTTKKTLGVIEVTPHAVSGRWSAAWSGCTKVQFHMSHETIQIQSGVSISWVSCDSCWTKLFVLQDCFTTVTKLCRNKLGMLLSFWATKLG